MADRRYRRSVTMSVLPTEPPAELVAGLSRLALDVNPRLSSLSEAQREVLGSEMAQVGFAATGLGPDGIVELIEAGRSRVQRRLIGARSALDQKSPSDRSRDVGVPEDGLVILADADLDAASERVRALAERVAATARENGLAWLEGYEKVLQNMLDLEVEAAKGTGLDWANTLATVHANFVRETSEVLFTSMGKQLKSQSSPR